MGTRVMVAGYCCRVEQLGIEQNKSQLHKSFHLFHHMAHWEGLQLKIQPSNCFEAHSLTEFLLSWFAGVYNVSRKAYALCGSA